MKTVITDLDGTLLKDGKLDEETICICKEFQKEHRFVLATGRNRESVKNIVSDLDLKNGCLILMNGMLFHDLLDNEIIKKDSFGDSEVKRIIKIAHACFFRVTLVCENERVALDSLYDRTYFLLRWIIKHKPMPKFFKKEIPQNVDKIEIGPTIFFSFFYWLFVHLMKNQYEIVKTSKYWVEILPKGVNKANWVKYLKDKYNLSSDDLHIFGDGENDIEMLKMSDNSYAPNNALESVKEVVNHICIDSVAKEIEKLI